MSSISESKHINRFFLLTVEDQPESSDSSLGNESEVNILGDETEEDSDEEPIFRNAQVNFKNLGKLLVYLTMS